MPPQFCETKPSFRQTVQCVKFDTLHIYSCLIWGIILHSMLGNQMYHKPIVGTRFDFLSNVSTYTYLRRGSLYRHKFSYLIFIWLIRSISPNVIHHNLLLSNTLNTVKCLINIKPHQHIKNMNESTKHDSFLPPLVMCNAQPILRQLCNEPVYPFPYKLYIKFMICNNITIKYGLLIYIYILHITQKLIWWLGYWWMMMMMMIF